MASNVLQRIKMTLWIRTYLGLRNKCYTIWYALFLIIKKYVLCFFATNKNIRTVMLLKTKENKLNLSNFFCLYLLNKNEKKIYLIIVDPDDSNYWNRWWKTPPLKFRNQLFMHHLPMLVRLPILIVSMSYYLTFPYGFMHSRNF